MANDPWETFCTSLMQAGNAMREANPAEGDLDLAEGYRFLMRMTRIAFDLTHEYSDPLNPVLAPMVDPVTSYEGAGSDARYLHAVIDGRETYRITGTLGTAPLIEVGVYNGKIAVNDTSQVLRSLTETDLKVADDGSLEIILSPNQHDGNWIQTDEQVCHLMIRRYSHDWERHTPGQFTITREGGGDRPALTLDELSEHLQRTAQIVIRQAQFWGALSGAAKGAGTNRFAAVGQASTDDLSLPMAHRFSTSYFDIGEDEALLCRFKPDDIPFWGFELVNIWYEVIGYGRKDTHLNNKTATYEDDGSVEFVITQTPLGRDNEILTLGHSEGTAMLRWSRTNKPIPEIEVQLVKHSELL